MRPWNRLLVETPLSTPNLEDASPPGELPRPRMFEPDWLAQADNRSRTNFTESCGQRRAVQAELEQVEAQLSEVRGRVEQARVNLEIEVAQRVRQIVANGRGLMAGGPRGLNMESDHKPDRARAVVWLRAAIRRYLRRQANCPPRHAFRGRGG